MKWREKFQGPGFFSGFLSFLLPGLGQVYQRRWGPSLAAFFPFVLTLSFPALRGLTLIVAAAAAWEAYRRGGAGPSEPTSQRTSLYASAAVMSFCFWGMLIAPVSRLIGLNSELNARMGRVAAAVRECGKRQGRGLETLSPCAEVPGIATLDPWGRPFRFRRGDLHFQIMSDGADGVAESGDDLTYTFRWR